MALNISKKIECNLNIGFIPRISSQESGRWLKIITLGFGFISFEDVMIPSCSIYSQE